MAIPVNANVYLVPVGSFPGSPVQGQVCVLSTDGHLYTYDGSGWIDNGATVVVPTYYYLDGFTTSDYYGSTIANPFNGASKVTLAALFSLDANTPNGERKLISSEGSDSGVSLGFYCDTDELTIHTRAWTDQGLFEASYAISHYNIGKWIFIISKIDCTGTDCEISVCLNGVPDSFDAQTNGGGTLVAGSASQNLKIGVKGTGSSDAANTTHINGVGYMVGNRPSSAQSEAWFQAIRMAGKFVDCPGLSMDKAWRVDSTDPGGTWAPFVGSGDMTEVGSVAYTSETQIQYI